MYSPSAARAAAAAAAKIAAQFSRAADPTGPGALMRHPDFDDDGPDGIYTHDIEINDQRNRYLLTKRQTQDELRNETGARVYTRGTWYPDRTKARPGEPPLYLHVTSDTRESLDRCVARINDLMVQDLPPLLDDRLHRSDQRGANGWPEAMVPITLEPLRNFNVRAKIVGPTGLFVKYIQHETRVRVQIKGKGSGYLESESGRELEQTMHIHLSGPEAIQVHRAKLMAMDLVDAVTEEWRKAKASLNRGAESQPAEPEGEAPPPPEEDAVPPPPPEGAEVPPPPEDDIPRTLTYENLPLAPPPTDAPPEDPEPPKDSTTESTAPALEEDEETMMREYCKEYVKWEESFVNYHGRRPTKEEGGQDVPAEFRA